jgi:hypothetical protein
MCYGRQEASTTPISRRVVTSTAERRRHRAESGYESALVPVAEQARERLVAALDSLAEVASAVGTGAR